jgi:predicted double-glycine peptidase
MLMGSRAAGVFLALVLLVSRAAFPAERVVKSLLEMRQQGVVIQQWDLSCGAAALATILRYEYDDPVTEREIARGLINRKEYLSDPTLVKVREGFSLLDLKRYVDGHGYEGIGYGALSLADLIEQAPILVPVNFYGYNHFVVFRGIRGNRVLLADPGYGNRTMLVEQFEDAWLNYPQIGRVGFVVQRPNGPPRSSRLAPHDQDFLFLR